MCTSFAVYNARPLYGMNFDFPAVPIWLRIKEGAAGPVFYLCFEFMDGVHEVAGLNTHGLFAAAQILVSHFEMHAQPGEQSIHPYEVFSHTLQNSRSIDEMLAFLGSRRLGYLPERKGHQFYADPSGASCVLEPGPFGNLIYPARQPFRVMANRPMAKELEGKPRPPADRFQAATRMIQACLPRFTLEDGWAVLRQTFLQGSRFITQASILCDPLAGVVHLALNRDTSRLWRIDLHQRCAETVGELQPLHRLSLTAAGVRIS